VIVGIGVDVCDTARFAESLRRTPALADRLFTEAERALTGESLAGRFAAKEALAKALGVPPGLLWHDAEVVREGDGRPTWRFQGTVLAAASSLGVTAAHLSLSHDGGIVSAFVVLEAHR
jgi:holo-[acyl-carrier protein] synthase